MTNEERIKAAAEDCDEYAGGMFAMPVADSLERFTEIIRKHFVQPDSPPITYEEYLLRQFDACGNPACGHLRMRHVLPSNVIKTPTMCPCGSFVEPDQSAK